MRREEAPCVDFGMKVQQSIQCLLVNSVDALKSTMSFGLFV